MRDDAMRVLRGRRAFRDQVSAMAMPQSDVDAAELIYGELVANTLRYAGGRVEVRLEHSDHMPPVLVVRDHGPGIDQATSPVRHDDPLAESGRGLAIVERLARGLEVERAEGGGTVVRATLPVLARPA
jgi:anti-sigma regulatory factor (Ser/Thr protein kinase)